MRKPFVAGNWKMNTDGHSSVTLAQDVGRGALDIACHSVDVAVCPPFVYLQSVAQALSSWSVAVCAQDIYYEQKGAFTGEISPSMLKDIGCTYALCGHSERRHVIGETDEIVNKKVTAAINGGILPIFCVGELLSERKGNKTTEVVWAIGTGLTATPQQAQEVHALIRKLLHEMYDAKLAQEIRILYGGSVKSDNSAELMANEDVDGLLVGGASMKADEFLAIIKACV
ncbi:MAG: triose-phosphate isomerase [Planctomycetota bacterium]|nr:triose-phosphate isomerase [Planctomycetota bacterium]